MLMWTKITLVNKKPKITLFFLTFCLDKERKQKKIYKSKIKRRKNKEKEKKIKHEETKDKIRRKYYF